MNTDVEVDEIAKDVCRPSDPNIKHVQELLEYCERHKLINTMGYVLLREKARDVLVRIQSDLRSYIGKDELDIREARGK